MNKKHKFLYILLCILTLGFICIYWRKKYRQKNQKDYLSVQEKLSFDYDEFLKLIGGKENITAVSATQKIVKIAFKDRKKVDSTGLKALDGITGISFQSQQISLVIGNSAKYLEQKIRKEME
ncbi:PTS glucose transporter subunit IIB [Mycoplasma phocoeninasale]|uniref:PTS glucose transporter subunit IIB n=1 Tax=Mycoplasma phocoeninasale TaxID=2726117 RepID=A0A858U3D5_9MOLU|nr:PTS glucose transporter subunit IIB [Mycoplasma phocoeninasale]MBN0970897.1 PTS glucose transporter subunit IIB [Mycoplasma phocoeninasale]QJG66559.1 PTS glucose transporter subunit IIB [Mycoplasma phocoeninasale]